MSLTWDGIECQYPLGEEEELRPVRGGGLIEHRQFLHFCFFCRREVNFGIRQRHVDHPALFAATNRFALAHVKLACIGALLLTVGAPCFASVPRLGVRRREEYLRPVGRYRVVCKFRFIYVRLARYTLVTQRRAALPD